MVGDKKEFGLRTGDDSEKRKRNKSVEQEDRLAEKGDGHRVPGSGAFGHRRGSWSWGPGGDVSLDNFKVEAKRTDHKSFRLSDKVLKDAKRDAVREGKEMAVAVEIGGIKSDYIPSQVVVLEEDVFFELLKQAKGNDVDDDD